MKCKRCIRAIFIPLLLCYLMSTLIVFSETETTVQILDSMIEIEKNLAEHRLGEKQLIDNDGYIGIPVELSVYCTEKEGVCAGIGGTPLILYVVNTNTERIGTKSDAEILASMLDRGYLVCVVDYLQNEKATTPALDWSMQGLRAEICNGTFFSGLGIPTADYQEAFVVPAGYDVSLSHSYWEIDKHSAAGTLEYITKVWNTDFRSIFGEQVIPWTDAAGNRKQVQTAYDGTSPEWLNSSGAVDTNGTYIKIKHTLAEDVEDCVRLDGSPIDMSLYMHIIYPTSPKKDVPVMCFAASSEHLASAVATANRPQMNGFVFSGYAGVLMDYGYVPMARADHYKEFSGTAGVTGDNVTYSVAFYNGVKINTAAMRYLRYLAASDETFAFDSEAIGIYGNSKGGWMTMLGEAQPELIAEQRFFEGHHGETRYEAGETADSASGLIKGGEPQPWLTYDGKPLDSGADLIYASCGGGEQHITPGHAPTYVSCNLGDSTYYATSNNFVNYCRNHDVPCLWLEVNKGHTFAYGEDMRWGVDAYDAFFTFSNYYLRNDAVSIVYTSFTKKNTEVNPAAPIVIKFSGAVSADTVKSITLVSKSGVTITGNWSAQFGSTEWTLTPSEPLASDTEYTLTIPATLTGDNQIAMGKAYTATFITAKETREAVQFASGTKGGYYSFTVNDYMSDSKKAILRFTVENNASNLVKIYPVTSYNVENPDDSVVSDTAIASCPIFGAGVYECDVASYIKSLSSGETATFLVKPVRNIGTSATFSAPLDSTLPGILVMATADYSYEIAGTEGTGALKVTGFNKSTISGSKESIVFYNNTSRILTLNGLIKNSALTTEDLARRFTISLRVYDTVSRKISIIMNGATSSTYGVADYNVSRYNHTTKAGEWMDISFDYVVREPLLGQAGLLNKTLSINADTLGDQNSEYPLYIDSIEVTETASAVTLGKASLAHSFPEIESTNTPYGIIPDEYADASTYPIAIFVKNGSEWQFKNASAIFPSSFDYNTDAVILLRSNYALEGSSDLDTIGAGHSLTVDLDKHTLDITKAGQYNSLSTYAKQNGMTFTLKNGSVYSNGKASLATIYSGGNNTVNLNFEELDITLGKSFSETSALIRHGYHSPANYLATYNITFTDCDIDISAVNNASLYAIRAGYGNGYDLNWTVNGGSLITGASIFYTKNLTVEKNGSLVFGNGKNGDSFHLITTADLTGEAYYQDLDGTRHEFSAVSSDGENYIHELTILSTTYGVIPEKYASAKDYPVAVFTKNNDGKWEFGRACTSLPHTFSFGADAVILLRRDISIDSYVYKLDTITENTHLLIDLGGKTLDVTNGGQYTTFGTHFKTPFSLTFKNGRIENGGKANLISLASHGSASQCITLEDLSIALIGNGSADGNLLTRYNSTSTTNKGSLNITVKNCDIDTTANSTTILRIFQAGRYDGMFNITYKVIGGTVKTASYHNKMFYAEDRSTLTFERDTNGEKTKFYLPADVEA